MDQDVGDIVFSTPNGTVVTCPVQIIGTFDSTDSTWLWAWDHPSVQPLLRNHASRLLEYGEGNSIRELTTRKLTVTEDQCWEFTALACKLNNAQGGYRGPSGSTLVFMTFGEPKLSGATRDRSGDTIHPVPEAKPTGRFTSDIPSDVRATVIGFIAALHDWEVASWAASEVKDPRESIDTATESYNAMIREWCVPDLKPQPHSFGSEPSHHPETECLISAFTTEGVCHVRTQHTNSMGFVSDHEYRLRFEEGRWLVASLLYLDQDGEHEML